MRGRQVILAAAAALTASVAWSQPGNPYLLSIDRTAYVLQSAGSEGYASAARGETRPALSCRERPERKPEMERAAVVIANCEPSGRRDHDQQLAQLAHERDGWKRRAEALEAALRAPAAWPPPLIPSAPR